MGQIIKIKIFKYNCKFYYVSDIFNFRLFWAFSFGSLKEYDAFKCFILNSLNSFYL
jgi:hypothetical protein